VGVIGLFKLNLESATGLLLFISLFVPWTVTWGTNIIGFYSSEFYVFEFPFMAYYVVSSSSGTQFSWEVYEFVPRYFGTMLIIFGSFLAVMGSIKQKYRFIEWGGVLGMLALVFFVGCNSASVYVPYALIQNYTTLPLGVFIPVLFWVMILLRPSEASATVLSKPGPSKMFCARCGREVSPEFRFCPYCGAESKRFLCPKCGGELSSEYIFCPLCGARLRETWSI